MKPSRIVCIVLAAIGCAILASRACAACCTVVYRVTAPTDPSTICTGTTITYCEDGAKDTDPGKKSTGTHKAQCISYVGASFCRCACDAPPGPGWVKLPFTFSDGMCCWVWGGLPTTTPDPRNFLVNTCDGDDCGTGFPA